MKDFLVNELVANCQAYTAGIKNSQTFADTAADLWNFALARGIRDEVLAEVDVRLAILYPEHPAYNAVKVG